MKKAAALTIALSLIISLTACQHRQSAVDAVSARGPMAGVGVTASTQTESEQTESVQSESVQSESVETESIQTESKQTESKQTESKQTESKQTESIQTESIQTESVLTEPEPYTYEGVTFDIPAGYTYETFEDGNIIVKHPDSQLIMYGVNVGKIDVGVEPMSQEFIESEFIPRIAEGTDTVSEVTEFSEYEIDGYPAQKCSYNLTDDTLTFNYITGFIYLDDKVIVLTFTSAEVNNSSVIEDMYNSIRITLDA